MPKEHDTEKDVEVCKVHEVSGGCGTLASDANGMSTCGHEFEVTSVVPKQFFLEDCFSYCRW